jgi:hypothetical protein
MLASGALLVSGCIIHTPSGVARTRAASDFDCGADQIEIVGLGGTSYRATGCEQTAVYNCSGSQVSVGSNGGGTSNYVCVPEGKPEAASDPANAVPPQTRRDVAPPNGAGGFTFGSTPEATQALCEAKFAWTLSGPDVFGCSGIPKSIGSGGRAVLKFCSGALCKVIFVTRPSSDQSSEWLHQFVALRTGLVAKYGDPVEDKEVPAACAQEILPCVRNGTAHVKYSWTFPGGTFIVLVLSNAPGPDPVIRLTYARGEAAEAPAL